LPTTLTITEGITLYKVAGLMILRRCDSAFPSNTESAAEETDSFIEE